jgi:hypothetical protein
MHLPGQPLDHGRSGRQLLADNNLAGSPDLVKTMITGATSGGP